MTFTEALQEVVTEVGDSFIYTAHADSNRAGMCRYVFRSKPDCMIARALYKMGVSVEVLKTFEGTGATEVLYRLNKRGVISVSVAEMWAAQRAQVQQDVGMTYGTALVKYKEGMASPDSGPDPADHYADVEDTVEDTASWD